MNDITKQLATSLEALINISAELVPTSRYMPGIEPAVVQRDKIDAIRAGQKALAAYNAKIESQEKHFLVSIVMTSLTDSGFNIKNPLYEISAANSDEAEGKAVNKALEDFNGYTIAVLCSFAFNAE